MRFISMPGATPMVDLLELKINIIRTPFGRFFKFSSQKNLTSLKKKDKI